MSGREGRDRTIYAAAAVNASVISMMTCFPFDSMKTRMQTAHYNSILDCAKKTYRGEGLRGFWRGVLPVIPMNCLVRGLLFPCYESSLQLYQKNIAPTKTVTEKALGAFAAGTLAGIPMVFLLCPSDVVKIQMQLLRVGGSKLPGLLAQRGLNASVSGITSYTCVRELIHARGLRGVFKGLPMQFARDTYGTGVYFAVYEVCNHLSSPTGNRKDNHPAMQLVYGALTGMISWVLIFPIDFVKARLQSEAFGVDKYKNTMDVVRQTWRSAGWRGFFAGLGPTVLRSIPMHAISLSTYELTVRVLMEYDNNTSY
eukprot:Rmarinus@m.8858